jgi:ribosomal-protein-alanine N-acetyltransferase
MASVEVEIQDLREDDLEGAARIDAVAFGPAAPDHGAGDRVAQLREELVRPWARLRAVRLAGQVAGYTLFWHVADEVHLLNVAVAPEHRRRGHGRALMGDLVGYARANGAAKVFLEVRVSNVPAIALYEAFGFERLSVRRRYYDDGEDALDMMLAVASA